MYVKGTYTCILHTDYLFTIIAIIATYLLGATGGIMTAKSIMEIMIISIHEN